MFLSARLFAIRWIKTLDLERNERSAKVLQKRMTKSRVLGEGGGSGVVVVGFFVCFNNCIFCFQS